MEDRLEFEELYQAYNLCLKNKKKKRGTYKFTNALYFWGRDFSSAINWIVVFNKLML